MSALAAQQVVGDCITIMGIVVSVLYSKYGWVPEVNASSVGNQSQSSACSLAVSSPT